MDVSSLYCFVGIVAVLFLGTLPGTNGLMCYSCTDCQNGGGYSALDCSVLAQIVKPPKTEYCGNTTDPNTGEVSRGCYLRNDPDEAGCGTDDDGALECLCTTPYCNVPDNSTFTPKPTNPPTNPPPSNALPTTTPSAATATAGSTLLCITMLALICSH